MKTPNPIARAQQIIGIPEHPCETIVRNGALICPYEEMEVQYYEEHAGLYLITLVGEPFEIFGLGAGRAKASLLEGFLPVVQHETIQQGCMIKQTAFACLLDAEKVVDGTEKLINIVKLSVTNVDSESVIDIPITIMFGSCFRKITENDDQGAKDYWTNFLIRDDIAEDLNTEKMIEPYYYKLSQENELLIAEDKGFVFCSDDYIGNGGEFIEEWNEGPWGEGKQFKLGWRINLKLLPGETKEINYKIPYLPLEVTNENRSKLQQLNIDTKLQEVKAMWHSLLNRGTTLQVPGSDLGDLWHAQTAATFILVDKQNKGSSELHGREMYSEWAGNYPDKILNYVHLSPSLYEFIWAQEAAFWVIGMLDKQGYHEEAENYLELFFELQGEGYPGVHDRSILPDKKFAAAYMGTTPHTWLNSTGGVLLALAEHYKLTKRTDWIILHKDSILSACRWIKELRKTTKEPTNNPLGYGLMPPGQSSDCTFASDHMQWYYTDIWTLLGLTEMAKVLMDCQVDGAEEFIEEAEDYKICFLKSLDGSILDLENFKNQEGDYDFTNYLYTSAFKHDKIKEYDEQGVPVYFKDKIILKEEAEQYGLNMFVPMSPDTRIPFKEPYLDNAFTYALVYLSGMIDFSSKEPLFAGAKHSGHQIWDGIEKYCKIAKLVDIEEGIYSFGLPYNDFLIKKFMDCDETDNAIAALNFVHRYGCDKETYMCKETAGAYPVEMWFQPCPFTLSMATMRSWIRDSIVYEDERSDTLVIGKAIQKQWMENAATAESPIKLINAASYYGAMSVEYAINFICTEIIIHIHIEDISRLPETVEIRLNHPQATTVKEIVATGIESYTLDEKKGVVYCYSARIAESGNIEIRALFNVSLNG